jgi:hypothetical protein
MILGIVGNEAAKFTRIGEVRARLTLRSLISLPEVKKVVSGGCHLGGIDLWAIEIARDFRKSWQEFRPRNLDWNTGYKPRNMKIAKASDEVHCIVVDELPSSYSGMVFQLCYHCGTKDHVKSGGCWTMKYAMKLGKAGKLHIIKNKAGI